MKNTTNSVIKYLETLPPVEKEVLEELRHQIMKIIPNVEERLSRGVPFFYYKGKRAVGFRSSKTHLSFFIMEGYVLKKFENEIKHLDVSSTVIRFNINNLIPPMIVEKLVLARIEEIESHQRSVSNNIKGNKKGI